MRLAADRPFADLENAARKLLEIASAIEVVQDGRTYIETINGQFLFKEGGTSLNHYGFIPEKAAQLAEFAKTKLAIPVMGWGGSHSFASHCYDSAKALSDRAEGGVIDECGHWVFEEKTNFICEQLGQFWGKNLGA